jgi:hypothetical protein
VESLNFCSFIRTTLYWDLRHNLSKLSETVDAAEKHGRKTVDAIENKIQSKSKMFKSDYK